MNIIEKLGIMPIEHPGITHMEVIRELEKQRNELIKTVWRIMDGGIKPIEEVFKAFEELEKAFLNCDPQHRSFKEIQELYHDPKTDR